MQNYSLKFKKNILLKNYTTFKIGGPAKYFFEAKSKEDLIEATNNLLFQILTLKKKNVKLGKEKIHKFVVARARDFVLARSAAMFQRSVNTHSVGWPPDSMKRL